MRSLLFGLVLAALSCGGHGDLSAKAVTGPFTWGGVSNVTGLSHLWFSGQPDAAALERAKAEGVTVVINLRDPSEFDWEREFSLERSGSLFRATISASDIGAPLVSLTTPVITFSGRRSICSWAPRSSSMAVSEKYG